MYGPSNGELLVFLVAVFLAGAAVASFLWWLLS